MFIYINLDSFGEWLSKKESMSNTESSVFLESLKDSFLEYNFKYVPILSGYLLSSAEKNTIIDNINNIVYITWTGLGNPYEDEFEHFKNFDFEDYALSNYLGFHYRTNGIQYKSNWVDYMIDDLLFEDFEELGSLFLEWLIKGK